MKRSSFLVKTSLIPRYNWDYGWGAFLYALRGVGTGKIPSSWPVPLGDQALATTSGRASLVAILQGLGLPPGAGVGVPLFCCPVVFEAVQFAGFRPIFVDVERNTLNMDPDDLAKKRSQMVAAVVVHIFGHPAEMDSIRVAAGSLPLIEDCCHSLFSTYRGRMTGTIGDASFFSFRSGKYLSAGEGSLVLTKDPALRAKVKGIIEGWPHRGRAGELLHTASTLAKSTFYQRPWYGTVSRPLGKRLEKKVNLTAKEGVALLRISAGDAAVIHRRLTTFRARIEKQRENALWLLEKLRDSGLSLPIEREGSLSNYYQFVIRYPDEARRDEASRRLAKGGVDAAPYGDGVPGEAMRAYGYGGGCREAEWASQTVLSIPHYYTLSPADLEKVASAILGAR